MDRGTWWAKVYGVAKSRIQLKQLHSMHPIVNTDPGDGVEVKTAEILTARLLCWKVMWWGEGNQKQKLKGSLVHK